MLKVSSYLTQTMAFGLTFCFATKSISNLFSFYFTCWRLTCIMPSTCVVDFLCKHTDAMQTVVDSDTVTMLFSCCGVNQLIA